jgi:adenylate cyclase
MVKFEEKKLVLLSMDLAGFTRAMTELDTLGVAALLEDYYAAAVPTLTGAGGRLVKLMGDGLFVVFPEEACVAAVDAAIAASRSACDVAQARALRMAAGANLHLATVAEGTFSVDGRYDIVGSAVNHLFRMGGGPGVRISEPVYLQLPNDRRAAWSKSGPPATYALSS